jgi:uncharacterized protein (TIGR00725 family)
VATHAAERPYRVAVIGAGRASPDEEALAHAVGVGLADAGAVVVCGGLGGVMEAAARGALERGGLTVGLLPGSDPSAANPGIVLPLATGLGEARNALVVRAAEAVIAVGGEWGTLSEIALARKMDIGVVVLGRPPASGLDVDRVNTPSEAVAWALERAGRGRRSEP